MDVIDYIVEFYLTLSASFAVNIRNILSQCIIAVGLWIFLCQKENGEMLLIPDRLEVVR